MVGASSSRDLAVETRLAQQLCGHLLDRLGGRIDAPDSLAPHHALGLLDLEAAVVELGVPAARPALLADLVEPLRRDRQAVEARFLRAQRLGQLAALEILGNEGIVRRLYTELERKV